VLTEFGAVCADRPMDLEQVSEARELVRKKGGDGLVLEASSIVGAFSLMTCVVD